MQWLIFGNAEMLRTILVWFLWCMGKCQVSEAVYIEKDHATEFTKQMNILLYLEPEEGLLSMERFMAYDYEIAFTRNGIKNKICVEGGTIQNEHNDKACFTF